MKTPFTLWMLCLMGLSACLSVRNERSRVAPEPYPDPPIFEVVPLDWNPDVQVPTTQPKAISAKNKPTSEAQAEATQVRQKLRCFFEGQRFLNDDKLIAALEFELQAWMEGSSIEVVADDCTYQLIEHYRSLGFASASVFAKAGQDDKGTILTFALKEGPQTLVADFQFPGAVETESLSVASLQVLYSSDKLPVWIRRRQNALPPKIEARYRSLGFLDATAGPATVAGLSEQSSEFERRVRIAIPVQAGKRYSLVQLKHNLPEELALQIKLQKALDGVQPGLNVPFELRWVSQWQRVLDAALTGAGYLDAQVQATVAKDQTLGQVQVLLTVQPGQKIRLGSIRYPESLKARRTFLNRQIRLRPGDPISAKAVDKALASLYRTGLFRTVRLQVEGTGLERDLVVELEEWPTQETFIEPGYGSFEGARLRAGWRHHNVLGVGRSLRIEGVLAENANRALIGWDDPWTLGHGWILSANADVAQRDLPAFQRNSSAVGVFGSRDFGGFDRWTVHTGLRFEEIRLNDVRVFLLAGSGSEEDIAITTLEGGIAYDSRNHPLLPSKGQKAHFTVQQTLNASGAANSFAKILSGWSYYHSLAEGRVLSLGARTVAVFPRDGEPHPLGLRIFSGGENSVRSFKESELGPLDADGTPVGGEGSSTLSIELTQRLGVSQFQAAAFVDVGNVVTNASDLFHFRDLETALGMGVRYVLPIGPLRLDWAHNPNAGDFQEDWVLHFSVGVAF
jgi:outer membrane protein insertion porin family